MEHSPAEWNERVLLATYSLFGIPKSHLDLGSGNNVMVNVANSLGVDSVGVDLEGADICHDLTKPLSLDRQFDLITCIEVGEHLPESAARTLCETIAQHRHANTRLIFSAATPGQSGEGHINLKPPMWWRALLWDTGRWSFSREWTSELALMWSLSAGPMQWLVGNVQVF